MRWLGLACSGCQGFDEPLYAPQKVHAHRRLEEGSLQRRPPRLAELLSFEVDGLRLLDDDAQRPPADCCEADLLRTGDVGGPDRMGEESQVAESTGVGDAVWVTLESGSNSQPEVFGGNRGS